MMRIKCELLGSGFQYFKILPGMSKNLYTTSESIKVRFFCTVWCFEWAPTWAVPGLFSMTETLITQISRSYKKLFPKMHFMTIISLKQKSLYTSFLLSSHTNKKIMKNVWVFPVVYCMFFKLLNNQSAFFVINYLDLTWAQLISPLETIFWRSNTVILITRDVSSNKWGR